jgi:hypothetical protein
MLDNNLYFQYGCECDESNCDLTFTMPHETYLELASLGPVLHLECKGLNCRVVLGQAGDAIATNGNSKYLGKGKPKKKAITIEPKTGVQVWK